MRQRFVLSRVGLAVLAVPLLAAAAGASARQAAVPAAPAASQSAEVRAFREQAVAVGFPSRGLTLRGWIYRPAGPGPFPAVIWNHGSEREPTAHPALGLFYVRHGYVLFLPVRHGHAPSPGDYIGDLLDRFKATTGDPRRVEAELVRLQEDYNLDVEAAVAWLRTQPYVAADRIAMSGVSYGGIQTLLAAEKGLGVRAFVPFAPAAMSWANRALQLRLEQAARRATAPLFLIQAQNDFSLGPSQALGPIITAKGGANRARVYPAFGTTHAEGHGAFAASEAGTGIWGPGVLGFLEETLQLPAAPRAGAAGPLAAVPGLPPPAAAPGPPGPLLMKWTVEGVERQGLVFAPRPDPRGARMPLLFAFHGHGGNMQGAARGMDFQRLWPEAIVVYLQGLATESAIDPAGRQPGWQLHPGQHGDRDLKLFDAVVAALRAAYPVDDRRIYATGMSNGASFCYFLWGSRPQVLAAIAPCAGRIYPDLHLTVPRPVLHIAGQTDHVVPIPDQMAAIAVARALDGAAPTGAPCGPGCTLYPSSKGAPVEVIVHPGGHVFPPFAAARIVEFLQAHALP
jgi:polyhydroxybutyrate depolymerase